MVAIKTQEYLRSGYFLEASLYKSIIPFDKLLVFIFVISIERTAYVSLKWHVTARALCSIDI
jgi:hypothetical protein